MDGSDRELRQWSQPGLVKGGANDNDGDRELGIKYKATTEKT